MKRAKRGALLKLLRGRPPRVQAIVIGNGHEVFVSVMSDYWRKLLEKARPQGGITSIDGRFYSIEVLERAEHLFKQKRGMIGGQPSLEKRFDFDRTFPQKYQEELSVTFRASEPAPEPLRKMALRVLKESFGPAGGNIQAMKDALYNISHEVDATVVCKPERLNPSMECDIGRGCAKPLEWYHEFYTADLVKRLAVDRAVEEHIGSEKQTPSDSTRFAEFFDKERTQLISELVREKGLVKAFEYQPAPCKPTDYTDYCVRSALSELENNDEE